MSQKVAVEVEKGLPDFDSIRHLTSEGGEFWLARELAPLLGYAKWQNFEVAIKRATVALKQINQPVADHITGVSKMIPVGRGAKREVKDYGLTRFACYMIAQNGDPRKAEIATAQAYFATSARENELRELWEEQQMRLHLRERIGQNDQELVEAAYEAGVLPRNFKAFQDAGYEGLYGGLSLEELKAQKNIAAKEEAYDRMGREELAGNDFRITQTSAKLRRDHIIGQAKATQTHREVGETVRKAIEEIGGTMPEELPIEPSLKPMLAEKRRRKKLTQPPKENPTS